MMNVKKKLIQYIIRPRLTIAQSHILKLSDESEDDDCPASVDVDVDGVDVDVDGVDVDVDGVDVGVDDDDSNEAEEEPEESDEAELCQLI